MNFRQIPPPTALQDHIRYYWVLESMGTDAPPKSFRTMADGCPGLIYQNPERGLIYKDNKQLPGIFVYGQATRYAEVHLAGADAYSTIGINFFPHALPAIFGLNAMELTDSCLNLDLIKGPRDTALSEQLANAVSVEEQIDILSAFLLLQVRKNSRYANEEMQYALSHIIQSKGGISLKELQGRLQLSERSFERRFKQYVGVSPKLFARISRFQASLSQLRNREFDKLSDIAFGNDYADQSHFIRTFKEFAGLSPYQFQKRSTELMDNFSELRK